MSRFIPVYPHSLLLFSSFVPSAMKRFLVTILALVYFVSSSGAVLHLHYCMGRLKSWDLFDAGKSNCGSCGMEKSGKGCCHDEQQLLLTEKDQQCTANNFQFPGTPFTTLATEFSYVSIVYPLAVLPPAAIIPVPPNNSKQPLFLRCRNFRI